MSAPTYTVTRLWRDPDAGFWRARVRSGDAEAEFDLDNGSWQTPPLDERGRRRDALPRVAAILQRALRDRTAG